jgi:hypothetical protein
MNKKNDNEVKEFLNNLSPSFCGAKWYNATVWLGSGMTTSCHHPPAHKIDIEAVKQNPRALHNTSEKKEQRRQMQCGERPGGCEYCWKIEDMGKDFISDRVYKSKIYTDQDLKTAYDTPDSEDVNLQTLEIAFDRTCNFGCSYCNPAFSSTWVKDLKQNGAYENLVSDGRNHFTHTHDSAQLYKYGETNPYVEAFFKWWESDLHNTLQELRITGGEPLMSPDLWRLFDWFKENNSNPDMRLAVNSNLGGKDDLIDRLISASHDIPNFHLYTSCEAMGVQAEYIRDGLEWNQYIKNLNRVIMEGDLAGLHMMCTVNALCLESLTEFLDLMLKYKSLFGVDFPVFTLNIVRFPSFQSPLVLPTEKKQQHSQQLRNWLEINKDNPLVHEMERNQVIRLIDYLVSVERPHSETSFEMPKLHNDFKQFYNQYDKRRNKDFVKAFPDLANWYRSL